MKDSETQENAGSVDTCEADGSQKLPMTVAEFLQAYQIPMNAIVVSSSNTRRDIKEEQCDTIWWCHPANVKVDRT